MQQKRIPPLPCLLMTLMLAGCAGENDGTNETETFSSLSEELMALTENLGIPARGDNFTRIDVCWVMSAQEFEDYEEVRGWVREAAESSWEEVAWIDYDGWDRRCSDTDPARRLYLDPTIGAGNTRGGAIRLNPNLQRARLTNRESVMMTAVHEFGHALAFHHPHTRYDWTSCPGGGVAQDTEIGVVLGEESDEPWSVLSYCLTQRTDTFLNTGSFLSAGDIEGCAACTEAMDDTFTTTNRTRSAARTVDT